MVSSETGVKLSLGLTALQLHNDSLTKSALTNNISQLAALDDQSQKFSTLNIPLLI